MPHPARIDRLLPTSTTVHLYICFTVGNFLHCTLGEPAAADRRGIGFGWLQNAWLLHARLKILTRRGLTPGSEPTQKTRGPVH
jgi:hypothetical protein